ncbi:hypothetical protein H072_347 [Dactylellina haptotyla CBS 200.50]|uniref:Non-structural maintenance of chromosomes element 4 n=1 Tax=Dactylellina haptotyla (strain CBS 200.50) TaxID=1284197 RepID=S8ARP1_DACHA|nr:hypothetical protein H072_347 [Dactylellina haptotyla CBS 200.50]
MARKVPRPSYGHAGKYEDDGDDQEDLYSDPYQTTSKFHRQASSTPTPQLSSDNPSLSPTSGSISDKENAPSRPRHRGSDNSPLVKKERGSIAHSARATPYAASATMSPAASRTSRASVASSRAPASKAASQSRSQTSRPSKTLSRATSRAVSAVPSRAQSRVPETQLPAEDDEDEEEEEDDEAEVEADVEEEEEEEEEVEDGGNGEQDEDQEVSDADEESTPEPTGRSRVDEIPAPSRSRQSRASQPSAHSQIPSSTQRREPTQFYDPNQSMAERRRVKGAYNDLQQELIDNRESFLKTGNRDLLHYISKTNELFGDVKQTGDAMVDGKIQLEIGKIASDKAKRVGNSNTNTGLDINEFISKCMQFMSKSRLSDNGDGHDWSYIGREAATPSMKRACPSDFMYGPMAIQKRQRVIKERKRTVRHRPEEFVRPIELNEKEIAKNENSTTKNVVQINDCLESHIRENELEFVNYFEFVINPHSYSQTIENMFYLAFLVRDGRVAMAETDDGLPVLIPSEPPSPEEAVRDNVVRKQIVMPMEKHIWRELIEVFQITDSIIPLRPREVDPTNGAGWYS